ncbi:WG repeat-containing protein [Mycoplasmatota bacterium]|nr:WG repeat-containing protein [Mycoplasmatota bacterium]
MKKTRSIASIFILVLIFLVGCNSNNNDISENAHAIIYTYPNQFTLIDVDGNIVTDYVSYIEDIYQVAAEFNEGLSPNLINGESYNYGYINMEFEIVVPHQYYYAGPFSEGLAQVIKDYDNLFIDSSGASILDVDSYRGAILSNGLTPFSKDEKWGYLDSEGKEVISNIYSHVDNFSEGYAVVHDELFKSGVIDKEGNKVVENIYYKIKPYSEGLAAATMDGYLWGYINTQGDIVVDFKYLRASDFCEGLAVVEDSELGILYINDKEEVEIDVDFYMAKEFHEGLAAVNDGSGKWGYINRKGDLVIDIQFDEAYDFSSSLVPLD